MTSRFHYTHGKSLIWSNHWTKFQNHTQFDRWQPICTPFNENQFIYFRCPWRLVAKCGHDLLICSNDWTLFVQQTMVQSPFIAKRASNIHRYHQCMRRLYHSMLFCESLFIWMRYIFQWHCYSPECSWVKTKIIILHSPNALIKNEQPVLCYEYLFTNTVKTVPVWDPFY